ncbi:hypothetical protein RO3G_00780 [Rhizopus delemar RA 99-880]|uniref:Uncharacterized protein n=1 Tax=Rhizopus delemar (strain RA 99-880 / ATCC MYA-4621 / FGSC 9543 / NRRL 43880) TaxID=246409 RepID=I1BIP6_RHIO9|nr:hypothetical protein RO3G_00780 [Rhizopus delemar RA 99-880]|eukprot:EIE76076.1 hypothetical protein RO3G_00780 [Rhizopus delemar RA 99-880]
MELAKLDVFVSRLDFKPYRAAHKYRLTRNVAWSDESRFCMKGSKRASTVKCGGGDAIVWEYFWGGGFGPLEMIDTGFVDQETCISALDNRFHPWIKNVTMHQEKDFFLPRGWSFLSYRYLCSMVEGDPPNQGL